MLNTIIKYEKFFLHVKKKFTVKNKKNCLYLFENNVKCIKYMPSDYLTPEIVLNKYKISNFDFFKDIPQILQTPSIIKLALHRNMFNYIFIDKKKLTKDIYIICVNNGLSLNYIPKTIKEIDHDLCKIAIKKNINNVLYLPYSYINNMSYNEIINTIINVPSFCEILNSKKNENEKYKNISQKTWKKLIKKQPKLIKYIKKKLNKFYL